MGTDAFIGEVMIFGGNFAPRNYALCNGQLLSIAQNTALFSLLGTTYGGDGQTTFALPDLRGRFPLHAGVAICDRNGGRGRWRLSRRIGPPGRKFSAACLLPLTTIG